MKTILSFKIESKKFLVILWLIFSIALAIFLLRDILFVQGLPYTRDLVFPHDINFTYSHLLSTWNENNSQQNLELNKIPLFFVSSVMAGIIGSEITIRLLFVIVLSSISFVMFISLYILFRDKVKSTLRLAIICCIPSIFYLFNPVVVDRTSNHIFMVFGMALNPLVFVLFIRILEKAGAGGGVVPLNIIIVTIVMTLTSIVSSHNTFYLLPILVFSSVFYMLHPKTNCKGGIAKATGIIFGIYFLINSYWLLPTLYHELSSGINPSYSITINSISKLSKFNTPVNVFGLIGGGAWDQVLMYPGIITQLSIYLSYVIPLFALTAIVFFPRTRLVVLSTVLFFILYFLALGTNSPLPLYQWVLESPIISGVLWLFRDPSRSLIYIAMLYSILIAFVIHWALASRKSKLKVAIISAILFAIIISPASFTFVNSAGNRLVSSQLPIEYDSVYNLLAEDTGDFNVLWLPFRQYSNYDWNNVEEAVAWNFYHESSPKPSIGVDSETNRNVSELWQYIYSEIILDYRSNELGKLLNLYGIKYLIVHDDLSGRQEKEARNLLRILSLQKDLEIQNQMGPYHVFKNLKYDPKSSKFIALSLQSEREDLSLLPPISSNSTNVLNIKNISKWNFSNSSILSEVKTKNNEGLLWKSKLNTSDQSSEIKFELQNANIRNFENLKLTIHPFLNNTGDSISVIIYSNTSKLTFDLDDLSLGKRNKEVLDLVSKRLSVSNKSSFPNYLNVTAIGFKIFNKDYAGSDNYFILNQISLIPDSKNGLYDSNIILDKWTQRNLSQSIISYYSKIDPTTYKIGINATEPYVLGYAKSFSPLWVAQVKAEGQDSEANSFPLYHGLNGFWTNITGQYEVEIKYKPQQWLLLGGFISIMTLIVLIGLVFLRYRKSGHYLKGH